MDIKELKELEDYIAPLASAEVAKGFASEDETAEYLLDAASDEFDLADEDLPEVAALIQQQMKKARTEHLALQASWPAITDFDRLEMAFQALKEQGIISRHDFSCCGTCGSGEILDEMAQEREAGMDVTGYVYYHQQDTDSAVEGHGLYLAYGTTMGAELGVKEVGQRLFEALQGAGLTPAWNGSTNTRVQVGLDWKRRIPA